MATVHYPAIIDRVASNRSGFVADAALEKLAAMSGAR